MYLVVQSLSVLEADPNTAAFLWTHFVQIWRVCTRSKSLKVNPYFDPPPPLSTSLLKFGHWWSRKLCCKPGVGPNFEIRVRCAKLVGGRGSGQCSKWWGGFDPRSSTAWPISTNCIQQLQALASVCRLQGVQGLQVIRCCKWWVLAEWGEGEMYPRSFTVECWHKLPENRACDSLERAFNILHEQLELHSVR